MISKSCNTFQFQNLIKFERCRQRQKVLWEISVVIKKKRFMFNIASRGLKHSYK